MRISKKVREEAMTICAIAASLPADEHWGSGSYVSIRDEIEASEAGTRLAAAAWNSIRGYGALDQMRDLEAEQLLRTGWSPGDEP